ncbi:MAG: transporter substrate-binding domain-containing protein, partial [Microcystaceae cyanobacterium]
TIALSVIFPQLSWAKTIEQEIQQTGILKVGIRDDSPLFGFGEEYQGYCADFAQELANQLSQKLRKTIKVNIIQSTTQNRWDLVGKGTVHVECGPNTISQEREGEHNIKFSNPFFVTATQIFVNQATTDEKIMRQGKIGIIQDTTNANNIQSIYPAEQIDDSFETRSQGIAAVQQGKITGFASDGILLMGTAFVEKIDANNYNIVTPLIDERPFCAAYGMLLPDNDENALWRETINNLISKSGQGAKIWDTWFADFLPYMSSVIQACQVGIN